MKAKDNKCDKGWHSGECCCNCKNQIELFKHPWNKINKGACSDTTNMYVCIVQHDCDKTNTGVIFEKQHGMCEMHCPNQRLEIGSEDALERVLYLYNVGRSFIHELIKKEETLKAKLSENLDLYKSKNLMNDYDKTFSQWNKCNLVLWDLKDILCRMGEDLD